MDAVGLEVIEDEKERDEAKIMIIYSYISAFVDVMLIYGAIKVCYTNTSTYTLMEFLQAGLLLGI